MPFFDHHVAWNGLQSARLKAGVCNSSGEHGGTLPEHPLIIVKDRP